MGIETAALAAYAAIGAAGVGTFTALSSARQQSKMADYQTAQAQADAATAASEAQLQARQIRRATDRQRAEARAALSGAGVNVGVGTAELIDSDINYRGEQDALMAIYGGTTRGNAIRQQGAIQAANSRNAASASLMQAGATALGGFSTVARGWNVQPAVSDGGYSIGQGSAYGGNRRGL